MEDDAVEPTTTPDQHRPWATVVAAAGVALLVLVGFGAWQSRGETERADATGVQLEQVATDAEDLAARIDAACRAGAVPIPYAGACAKAQEVQAADLRMIPGERGARGSSGADGAPGADGQPGATGGAGPTGAPGSVGATGAAGTDGAPGLSGPPGAPGASGPAGPSGPPGAPGDRGVGIAESRQDPDDTCYRLVTYDDGRTERWGPFCPAATGTVMPP